MDNEFELPFSYLLCIPLVFFFVRAMMKFRSDSLYTRSEGTGYAFVGIFGGGLGYYGLFEMIMQPSGEWDAQIYTHQNHNSLSAHYIAALAPILILGIIGLLILMFGFESKLPPLVSIFSIASVVLANILQIVYFVQIVPHATSLYFWIYHIQLLVISSSLIRSQVRVQVAAAKEKSMDESRKKYKRRFYALMSKVSRYNLLIFTALIIIIALLEILFILCGQSADAPIKAFTNTADWTFSQQSPPPPMVYDGHYLCTVAAGGHRKVVKPLRYGTRLGETIVVNRQLCVANAFEDLIKEKLPRFHKVVRGGYDKYGYPVSKHITTPLRADIVYFIMKPLEWTFLFVLYLFDKDPESRISRQYEYRKTE